jgi:hypothetical protein
MAATSDSRRDFLRLLALAPLTAAGCVTVQAGQAAGASVCAPAAAPPAGASDPLLALRAVPLAPSVEPALVFRALGGRGRCA